MTLGRIVCASAALLLAWSAVPVRAEEAAWRDGHGHWRATHAAIYQLENRIAYLEADPDMDDGYKAPIIPRARSDIRQLRATLPPAHWRWASPCCYSRKPIHIR
jgi:hypothetical protein